MNTPRFAFQLLLLHLALFSTAFGNSLDQLEQKAFRAAVASVEPYVVQLRTVGGMERVGKTFVEQGPTTGLIVSADGYIVSSAFNFAAQPTSILVRFPNGDRAPAQIVARDKNRMLVLLKVETEEPLPVPPVCPHEEIQVGQWSIALGRTFRADRLGVSTGIISGLNRMYGRVVQTDASVSVANYGGPLIDLEGRVMGVLVPMAPQSNTSGEASEVAGAEFYDSGIGFAVPLEHILAVLPRWKEGEDLLPGKLGIGLQPGNALLQPPKITSVWPNSPASRAQWKANDLIVAVNGQPVSTQAHLRFELTPRYAGDAVTITIKRGEEEIESPLTLAGELAPYQHAFLGILPSRQPITEEDKGLLVRDIWPGSPADTAGLLPADRLLKINETEISSLFDAVGTMNRLQPGEKITLTIKRDDEEITFSPEAASLPEEVLKESSHSEELAIAEKGPAQLKALKPNPLFMALEQSDEPVAVKYYAPQFAEGVRPGLLFWLADGSDDQDLQLLDTWQKSCRDSQFILAIVHPEDETGWTSKDLKSLQGAIKAALANLQPNPLRTIVAGEGKAGQLAFALALASKSRFSGVISLDAPLPRTLKVPEQDPNRRLAILSVKSQNSSLDPLIRRDVLKLRKERFPVSLLEHRSIDEEGHLLDVVTQRAIARWIDTLDRF